MLTNLTTLNRAAKLTLAAGALSFAGLAAGAGAMTSHTQSDHHARQAAPTIVEIAAGNENFSTLVTAVQAAELIDTLNSDGPFTVFAPTNDAFGKLDQRALENTLDDSERLTQILTYHVVAGRITAADLANRRFLETVNGNRLEINREGGLSVNSSTIVAADIEASNGLVHVIDTVLIPTKQNLVETAADAGSFGTLIAAAQAAGLAGFLQSDGPLTVFAPTDDAFAALGDETIAALLRPENKSTLAAILSYHVLQGRAYSNAFLAGGEVKTLQGEAISAAFGADGLRLNGSTGVTATDLGTTNGVIHVIDEVLLPPSLADQLAGLSNPLRGTSDPVVATLSGAIDGGAALFNNGQEAACAAVYAAAAEMLVNYQAFGATADEQALLAAAVTQSREQSARDAAWTLRRAFDRILASRLGQPEARSSASTTASRDHH